MVLGNALARWRLLGVPLERDEGEYAYGAQLLLDGLLPYRDFYSMKLPGIYAVYAAVMTVFGETVRGVHLGLLVACSASIVLVFLLTRRLLNDVAGMVAAVFFAALALSRGVLGFSANAEQFVLPLALGGLLVALRTLEAGRWYGFSSAGALLGLAVLVKQQAVFFALAAALLVILPLWRDPRRPSRSRLGHVTALLAGVVTPYAVTCLVYLWYGSLDEFARWTLRYAATYSGLVGLSEGGANLGHALTRLLSTTWPVWLLAGWGAVRLVGMRDRRAGPTVAILAACSFLAVAAGFYFRSHYFVLFLPALAMLVAVGLTASRQSLGRVRLLLCATALAVQAGGEQAYLFRWEPERVSREMYGLNPFPESVRIGAQLAEWSDPDDRIAVIGSEPQIYFYSRRRAATGFIYMYPLMEAHDLARSMQRQMIRELEADPPEFMVYVQVGNSWLRRPTSPDEIFDWFHAYTRRHYRMVEYVDLIGEDNVVFVEEREIPSYQRQSKEYIAILRRK